MINSSIFVISDISWFSDLVINQSAIKTLFNNIFVNAVTKLSVYNMFERITAINFGLFFDPIELELVYRLINYGIKPDPNIIVIKTII